MAIAISTWTYRIRYQGCARVFVSDIVSSSLLKRSMPQRQGLEQEGEKFWVLRPSARRRRALQFLRQLRDRLLARVLGVLHLLLRQFAGLRHLRVGPLTRRHQPFGVGVGSVMVFVQVGLHLLHSVLVQRIVVGLRRQLVERRRSEAFGQAYLAQNLNALGADGLVLLRVVPNQLGYLIGGPVEDGFADQRALGSAGKPRRVRPGRGPAGPGRLGRTRRRGQSQAQSGKRHKT